MSRAVRPVCSSDMAALIARAKSQQGAECIWDVMHDCLPSLHGIMIIAQCCIPAQVHPVQLHQYALRRHWRLS